MRRLAIMVALAFVISGLPTGGVGAQIVLPEDRVHPEIDLDIRGFQMFYDYEATGTNDRTGQWPSGFIASADPTPVTPIRFGVGPSTYWLRKVTNNDPITHHLAQCSGGQQDLSQCVLVPDSRFNVVLGPGESVDAAVYRFDDFPDGMIILTCSVHRGMRAEIFKERFCSPHCED